MCPVHLRAMVYGIEKGADISNNTHIQILGFLHSAAAEVEDLDGRNLKHFLLQNVIYK